MLGDEDDLFNWKPPAKPDLDGMHRKPDHETSIEAAEAVVAFKTVLQGEIYALLLAIELTDGELERLPQFEIYGPSTVRKRRSELYQDGRVVWTGHKRGRFKVWRSVRKESKA